MSLLEQIEKIHDDSLSKMIDELFENKNKGISEDLEFSSFLYQIILDYKDAKEKLNEYMSTKNDTNHQQICNLEIDVKYNLFTDSTEKTEVGSRTYNKIMAKCIDEDKFICLQ